MGTSTGGGRFELRRPYGDDSGFDVGVVRVGCGDARDGWFWLRRFEGAYRGRAARVRPWLLFWALSWGKGAG